MIDKLASVIGFLSALASGVREHVTPVRGTHMHFRHVEISCSDIFGRLARPHSTIVQALESLYRSKDDHCCCSVWHVKHMPQRSASVLASPPEQ
jgi:hypothetical protein